jgi:hypothetical protein
MSDFKRGAFNYIAYYLRSGKYLPGSRRTETILTYHRAEKSRNLRRVELSSSLYSSMDEGTLGEEQDAIASIERQVEGEISKYQTLSYLKITSDPLLWWKQKQFQFPILSCLARKYLCIPATEAPSERIFSTASLLLSKFRNRMDPDLAGRMIFIKKNFEWYEEFLQKASEEE